MPNDDEYLQLLRKIVDNQKKLVGKKVALGKARSAPLRINPDHEIEEYYGEGKNAVDLLLQQYEKVWGKDVADKKMQRLVEKELDEEEYNKVPERIRPEAREEDNSKGLVAKLKKALP
ncbi:MAG: hypothetical protein ABEK04_02785 [Candidatus Nanohalobium sp.]